MFGLATQAQLNYRRCGSFWIKYTITHASLQPPAQPGRP
jgi:hypothetical protein